VRYGEIVGLYTEVERLRESRMAIAEQLIAAQVMVDAARAEQGPNKGRTDLAPAMWSRARLVPDRGGQ